MTYKAGDYVIFDAKGLRKEDFFYVVRVLESIESPWTTLYKIQFTHGSTRTMPASFIVGPLTPVAKALYGL